MNSVTQHKIARVVSVIMLLIATVISSAVAQTARLSQSSHGFSTVAIGSTSPAWLLQLTNTGTAVLTVSSITASGDFSQTNTCTNPLTTGTTCTISIVFTPTAVGARNGIVTITDNASNSPQIVTVRGTGVMPVTVTPASHAFGQVAIGTSAATVFTVKNNQTVPLNGLSITTNVPFGQTNTCGPTLAAGAQCTINATFSPTVIGIQGGTVVVAYAGAVGSPVSLHVQGNGVRPLSLTPAGLGFGSVALGTTSVAQNFVLRNNLTTVVTPTVSLSAPFTSTNTCGTSLAPQRQCTISVLFVPAALGIQTGTLTVNYGSDNVTATVQGTGIPAVALAPAALTFSLFQRVGVPSTAQSVRLTNNQNTALSIQSIVSSLADYTQTNTCGVSLAARASCTVSVIFTPTAAGSRPATLTITDSAQGSPHVVSLSGSGSVNNLVSITVSLPSPSLAAGLQQQMKATGTYANGTVTDITNIATWSSSSPGIAAVSPTGMLSALTPGAATITAILAGSAVQGTAAFTVAPPLLTQITVSPASTSVGLNATQQYQASGLFTDQSTADITNQVTWTSGNSAIVSITNPGGMASVLGTSSSAIPITATMTNAANTLISSQPAWLSALSTLPIVCANPTIDMKLLVITSGKTEADYGAITQILDYMGTPYDVVDLTVNGGVTSAMLSDGSCHGYYQGVIFAFGGYIYNPWMATLTSYEQTFKVRQLNWYMYPNNDFGFSYPYNGTVDSNNTLRAAFTPSGASVFSYANTNTPVRISNAFTYLGTPLSATSTPPLPTGASATPLLADDAGNALSLIYTFGDGREYLTQTFDSNQYLQHNLVLAYGLINWVTKGIFLGEYHVYSAAQVDDFFINDSEWIPGTPCTNPITHDRTPGDDPSLPTFRLTSSDMTSLVAWQNKVASDPLTSTFKLTMAFNGAGTTGNPDWTGLPTPGVANDDLTLNVKNYEQYFHWINHTFDHPNTLNGLHKSDPGGDPDTPQVDSIDQEILTNRYIADGTGSNLDNDPSNQSVVPLNFTDFNPANLVTPGVTGLNDLNVPGYLYADGIRYVVTDTSMIGQPNNGPNPSPNAGIVNIYAPGLYEVPRHPNNIFFNAANWNDDEAEFHCIYTNPAQPPYDTFTAAQILDFVSTSFVNNMLKGDIDPEMFHQPNLHDYDGQGHSLISDTYDQTFLKYKALFKLPVLSLTLDQIGMSMQARNAYNLAQPTASLVGAGGPGQQIVITIPSSAPLASATVPVTGLASNGSESYGGQPISHIPVSAGQTVTLPVQ